MKNTLLITVLSITFFSCSKDPVNDSSKLDALTTGTWKLTGSMTDYEKDGVFEENTYAMLSGCIKDNIYTFQSDGSSIIDEGPTKCYSNAPQTVTSSWSFSDNQTRIQFGGVNYQIEALTTTTFSLKGRVPYNVIYTIDVKSTYTKL
ncbi:lipocalin family protein [Flavobacterium sp.]|uniref:lipocalin family protein n=1 Tax=Flavobacterium sp. TaxID=239 RepID=UPI003753680E